jgi:hypothetical protein
VKTLNLDSPAWTPGESNGALRDRCIRERRGHARQSVNPNRGKRHAARLPQKERTS